MNAAPFTLYTPATAGDVARFLAGPGRLAAILPQIREARARTATEPTPLTSAKPINLENHDL